MSFFKKSISVLLVLSMVFSLCVCAFAAGTGDNDVPWKDLGNVINYGDVNNSGAIDIFDLISMAKAIVSNDFSNCNEAAADLNKSGAVDIFDLIALAKKIVAQG